MTMTELLQLEPGTQLHARCINHALSEWCPVATEPWTIKQFDHSIPWVLLQHPKYGDIWSKAEDVSLWTVTQEHTHS